MFLRLLLAHHSLVQSHASPTNIIYLSNFSNVRYFGRLLASRICDKFFSLARLALFLLLFSLLASHSMQLFSIYNFSYATKLDRTLDAITLSLEQWHKSNSRKRHNNPISFAILNNNVRNNVRILCIFGVFLVFWMTIVKCKF
jgi:hypothetical protein